MNVMPVEEPTFNEFVVKEVLSAVYYVTGIFTAVASLCEYDMEEPEVTRKQGMPSQELMPNAEKEKEKDMLPVPRGLFAMSFDKIPCDQIIKPCQFRTGRRYIQADNFPDDDGLDHYLGLMDKISSRMERLRTDDSTLSFDFATEDHLDFVCLAQEVAEKFQELDEPRIQALKAYYPHHVDYLSESLDETKIIEYFTSVNGEEDYQSLQEFFFYIRELAEDAQDFSTRNPQSTPTDHFLPTKHLDTDHFLPKMQTDLLEKCSFRSEGSDFPLLAEGI